MNADVLAARLERLFNCDVHIMGTVRSERPAGGYVIGTAPIERSLRGRVRAFRRDRSDDTFAGAEADSAAYLVTVPRYSAVPIGARLVVMGVSGERRWRLALRVVGTRGPKSTYVADQLACVGA